MKWAYINSEGKPVYQEIQGKVDFYCSAMPQVTLMTFKQGNNWIVAEYLTGVKIGVYAKRADAKKYAFTPESVLAVTTAFALHKKQGRIFPPVNEAKTQEEAI